MALLSVGGTTKASWCLPAFYQDNHLGAQTVTVAVRVRVQGDPNAPAIDLSGIFATMTWGAMDCASNGCPPDCQTVDFDVINGAALTVEASNLQVLVSYPGLPGANHPDVDVEVSVAIGTSGKAGIAASAQRTVLIGDLAAGGSSGALPIPPWAVGAMLVNTTLGAPIATLTQLTASNAGVVVSVANIGKDAVADMPIARGRGALFFILTSIGATTGNAVIFDLCPN